MEQEADHATVMIDLEDPANEENDYISYVYEILKDEFGTPLKKKYLYFNLIRMEMEKNTLDDFDTECSSSANDTYYLITEYHILYDILQEENNKDMFNGKIATFKCPLTMLNCNQTLYQHVYAQTDIDDCVNQVWNELQKYIKQKNQNK